MSKRKRRKTMADGDKYHARKMREIGMSLKDCADYFDVSVATLCRGLAELRERMGQETICESRRHLARPGLRSRASASETI